MNALAQLDFKSFPRDARVIIGIGWPLILNNFFNIGVNVADTLMVGRLGATQLAGLSIGLSLWIGVFLTGLGVIMALGPTVSQHYGARRLLQIGRDTRQAVWLALIFSALVVVVLNNVSPLLLAIGIEADVVELAQGYLRGLSIGVPGCYLYHVMRQMNEGIGRTVPIMVVMGISLVVNVSVSYCLVFGLFGLPAMGVLGSGLGNGITYWVSFLLIVVHVSRSPTYRQFELWQRIEAPDFAVLKRLVGLGGPIGLSLLMQAGLFTALALLMGTLGKTYAAAHQIALNYAGLVFMLPLGIGFGTAVLVGQHIGAGDPQHARRIGITGIVMCTVVAAIVAVFTLFARYWIAGGYTQDAAVVALAGSLLGISTCLQVGDGTQSAAASALRGIKDTRVPMLINGVIYWGIGFALAWTLGIQLGYGAHGIWIGLSTALCVAAVVLSWRFAVVIGRAVKLWDAASRLPR